MGVSYREELSKNKKKGKRRPESTAWSPRTAAEERAALRKKYFGVSRDGYRQMAAQATKRLLDA